MKRSQLTMNSIQEELRYQDNRLNTSYRKDSKEVNSSLINMSQQHEHKHIVQSSMDDFKTKAIKKGLMEDVKMTMLANKLQCKPIEGHDIPMQELQQAINGTKTTNA